MEKNALLFYLNSLNFPVPNALGVFTINLTTHSDHPAVLQINLLGSMHAQPANSSK